MNLTNARLISDQIHEWVRGACDLGQIGTLTDTPLCVIAGSVRRLSEDVHDIEIVSKPSLKAPRPEFGTPAYKTEFDKVLARLEKDGYLRFLMGAEKLKKYEIHLQSFGLANALNSFKVEFYQCTPPAQFGVLLAIRTGPAKDYNNFSKWIVTQRKHGGVLPNGYRVKHAAVWHEEQLDSKDEPIKGETPLYMPDEMDFFNFLEVKWIEPSLRVARWKR